VEHSCSGKEENAAGIVPTEEISDRERFPTIITAIKVSPMTTRFSKEDHVEQ
jgi:hypothetical protein